MKIKHNHVALKNPVPAQKTAFKDYFFFGVYLEAKDLTIRNGLIVAVRAPVAKHFNLETVGEVFICEKVLKKEEEERVKKVLQDAENKRQCAIMVAIIRKDAAKLNKLLNN